MTIIRSPEHYNRAIFRVDEAIQYGLEKAIILEEISKYEDVKKENLHWHFPYFEKNEFYVFLDELFAEGLLRDLEEEAYKKTKSKNVQDGFFINTNFINDLNLCDETLGFYIKVKLYNLDVRDIPSICKKLGEQNYRVEFKIQLLQEALSPYGYPVTREELYDLLEGGE